MVMDNDQMVCHNCGRSFYQSDVSIDGVPVPSTWVASWDFASYSFNYNAPNPWADVDRKCGDVRLRAAAQAAIEEGIGAIVRALAAYSALGEAFRFSGLTSVVLGVLKPGDPLGTTLRSRPYRVDAAPWQQRQSDHQLA